MGSMEGIQVFFYPQLSAQINFWRIDTQNAKFCTIMTHNKEHPKGYDPPLIKTRPGDETMRIEKINPHKKS